MPTTGKPFMTAIITFEDEAGQTRYTATVRHWSAEDKKAHEAMGFHSGWGQCTDQLAALAKEISRPQGGPWHVGARSAVAGNALVGFRLEADRELATLA